MPNKLGLVFTTFKTISFGKYTSSSILEKYNQDTKPINLFKTLRFQVPYSVAVLVILLALVIVWYIIGLPLGIGGVTTSV